MRYLLIIISLLWCTTAFAQLDDADDSSGKYIGRESDKSTHSMKSGKAIGRSFSSGHSTNLSLIGKPKEYSFKVETEPDKVNMLQKNEFVRRTIEYTPDYLNKEEGKAKEAYTKPQDLGRYYTTSDFVKISWRDAQVVDGDRVDIIVNGEVVAHNVTLLGSYHSIYVDLDKSFTKIEFQALNQGASGPNTADFKVEAAGGTTLTHSQWNLATGVKAHLIIIRE